MAKLVGTIHIDHPGAREREQGAQSRVYFSIDRGLRSGKLDEVELSEDDLLALIKTAAQCLQILRANLRLD